MRIIHTTHAKLNKRAAIVAWVSGFVFAALLLAGCAVRLIGDYDDTIDKGVTDVQQKAELYLSKLQSTPNTPYDQGFYDDINARLAVLKSRAASLPKYPIIVEQLTNLKSQFDTLQKLDKASTRPFPSAAVTDAESAISVSIESILKLELALRERGQASPPSLTKTSK
jgi:PBP1b-binding outer membrane lipoprotein LpoB